jgi:hypothetical protein
VPDEALHRDAAENIDQADALLEFGSGAVAMLYEP